METSETPLDPPLASNYYIYIYIYIYITVDVAIYFSHLLVNFENRQGNGGNLTVERTDSD